MVELGSLSALACCFQYSERIFKFTLVIRRISSMESGTLSIVVGDFINGCFNIGNIAESSLTML